MRYFKTAVKTNKEAIEENTKVRLRDYSYDSPIAAVNTYMYRMLPNGMTFIMYRIEGDNVLVGFSYDEKIGEMKDAFAHIMNELKTTFGIKKFAFDPIEITMFEYLENIEEARRREFGQYYNRLIDNAKLWIFGLATNNWKNNHFDFHEQIISKDRNNLHAIYDEKFRQELSNIEEHANTTEFNGNMVHYVISARSKEACMEMTETLCASLLKANRIKNRRVEIIEDIDPDFHKIDNHIEEIIENNYGGTIVFDLTERFGHDSTDYLMVCKYIEGLLKKYKNECLFIFTYNMESPGFSYYLLPNLKKYVLPILLREGAGDRKDAVNYLKSLIEKSDYAAYSNQAAEYLNQYAGDKFTQTDILQAYEQFEAWCLNRNMLQAYNYDLSGEFSLDRNEIVESSYEKLQGMIGLDSVKKQVNHIISNNIVERERKKRQKNKYQPGTMHMIFAGNPGTAKTTVARLFAGIAKEKGILKSGAFVEKGGMELDGLGAEYYIREAFVAAKGGVLFIDEAYSLKSDYAVTVLIQEMENHREDVIVILAGYSERMESFMEINEGLRSRIPYWIDFPDYDADELIEIFKLMLLEKGMQATDDAMKEAYYILDKKRYQDNFGNGRYVRNLMEHAIQKQSVRLLEERKAVEKIENKELYLLMKEDIAILEEGLQEGFQEERIPGTAENELNEMVGLTNVKKVINKAKASFKLKKLCIEKGISKDKLSLHMVFTGNPGTAKTTVARLFAEILKDEKVLATGKFVEVGRADLVGTVVGSTAPLVKRKFREAKGGILFIDEAYSLCDGYEGGYGDEAINTIVQEMENNRDNVIVIFAGYPNQMKQFLDRNPGLLSRIAFQIPFEDYTVDELCAITKLMLDKKKMSITEKALDKLKLHYDGITDSKDYGNGRFVRKLLEEVEMNQAERLLQLNEAELSMDILTTIVEVDIPEKTEKRVEKKKVSGFSI